MPAAAPGAMRVWADTQHLRLEWFVGRLARRASAHARSVRGRRRAAAFFALFLTAQVAIPAVALREKRPARFGWQMYSGLPPRREFIVRFADGSAAQVLPADYLVSPRAEVHLEDYLPAHLCREITGVVAVRAVLRGGVQVEERRCPR